MSKEKVVSRNVAIALGIITIILIVGIVGAIANYRSTIDSKDATISTDEYQLASLNSQLSTANSTIASLNSQISTKNSQIASLNSQVGDLTNTINLAKSTTWVDTYPISQGAGGNTSWTFSVSYAGYVTVWVQTSTGNIYARVIYSSYGVDYDHQIQIGTSGTAVFPVLPSSAIAVIVGNSNWIMNASATVTITYHY